VNDNYGYDTKFISISATGNLYKQLTYIKPTHYLSTKAVRKHTAILGLHLSTNHIISHISVMTGNCSVICVIHTLDKEHINIIFRIISDVLY